MIGYGWRRTGNLNVAAALATCGVKVIPITALDEPSGRRTTEFHLRDKGHLPAPVLPPDDPQRIRERFNLHRGPAEPWDMDAGILRRHLEDGTLEAADPEHPALDALYTLHARECLLTFMNRGTRHGLLCHPRAPRARYQEGPSRFTEAPALPTFTTEDLAMAAALSRIGCPVLRIEGVRPHRRFVLPRFGHVLTGRVAAEDAQQIMQHLLSGELAKHCPEHPAVWGYAACKARLILLQAIEGHGSHRQVLLHHRSGEWSRTRRSALVEERAPDTALDAALKHLRG